MDTFHHFTDLPVELRRMIWAEFLAYESERRRLVLVDSSRCIRPKLELCSPLLSVNAESRAFARGRYYTVALLVREASSRRSKGTLYVNPELDTFLMMEEFDWNAYRAWRISSSAANPPLAEKYATRRMPRRACARVRNSMETSSYWVEEMHDLVGYFDPAPFWEEETRAATFKGLERCIHLLTDAADDEMPSIDDDLCRISLEDFIAKYNQRGQFCLTEKEELQRQDGETHVVCWYHHSDFLNYDLISGGEMHERSVSQLLRFLSR
ncbi:hypothetical protein DL769_011526 [Monosporascus sp. CRB-8-3]|nr:hypothetical protein DL769_011526 [Monosporascus sp. CRB-8-3]